MDEAELDAWFVQTKAEITEKYQKELAKTQNFEKCKAKYDKMFKKLIHDYQSKQNRLIDNVKLKKQLKKPGEKVSDFMDTMTKNFEEKT